MSRTIYAPLALALLGTTACAQDHARRDSASVPPAIIEITKADKPTVFIGEGRLPQAPEYLELSVTINAECHATPMEASAAADAAVASVMSTLRGTLDADEPRDGVFSQGGYTRAFERYVDSRTVCRGTYAKTVTLTAKTSRVAHVQAQFSKLQQELLAGSLRQPSPGDGRATTYATLSEPQPRLYHETRERLEQQALADALRNARDKLEATAAAGCGTGDYEILRMVERSPDDGRPIAYARSTPASGSDTMELDAIWINKLLEVSFVTSGRCSAAAR